jgi:hypothetical protein
VPEVRRMILAMTKPKEEREFRLGRSLWRRAHQAVAKRCHTASREAKRDLSFFESDPLIYCIPRPRRR